MKRLNANTLRRDINMHGTFTTVTCDLHVTVVNVETGLMSQRNYMNTNALHGLVTL